MRKYLFVLFLILCHTVGAAEVCYFTPAHVAAVGISPDCADYRAEAEDYLAKSGQACAWVVSIAWDGPRETVRCKMYDGSVRTYSL